MMKNIWYINQSYWETEFQTEFVELWDIESVCPLFLKFKKFLEILGLSRKFLEKKFWFFFFFFFFLGGGGYACSVFTRLILPTFCGVNQNSYCSFQSGILHVACCPLKPDINNCSLVQAGWRPLGNPLVRFVHGPSPQAASNYMVWDYRIRQPVIASVYLSYAGHAWRVLSAIEASWWI